MKRQDFIRAICLAAAACPLTSHAAASGRSSAKLPNIIYILADDLGYGDVHAFNPQSKVSTPNIDGLAKEGRRFIDAHSGSAVSSPTRYGILTGRYCWRTPLKAGVLIHSSTSLIDPDRLTVPSLLKKHGYQTACIGKWHLGLERPGTKVDYHKNISFGPNQLGFDYAFYAECTPSLQVKGAHVFDGGIDPATATQQQLGSTWVENGKVMPDYLKNWKQNEVGPTITRKAVAVIDRHGQSHTDQPLFMYLALSAVHNPVAPASFCEGKSGIGVYGDFISEVDWSVGEVLQALERNHLADNTLVIFTSDNGADKGGVKANLAKLGHHVSYNLRGCKADIFEGGHRIPFIARWPQKIQAASTSDEVICLTDLIATCAAIVGDPLPANAGEDSYNILPALLGEQLQHPIREATVHHSIVGTFAIRQGPWKLILGPDSGGWSAPKPGTAKGLPPVQLYNLKNDLAETTNLQHQHPEIVRQLTQLLDQYKSSGRSASRQ